MESEKLLKIMNFFFTFLIFFKMNYPLSLLLCIHSVFIRLVLSSVHVYALSNFLQNIPSGWKGAFSMLTANKKGKY